VTFHKQKYPYQDLPADAFCILQSVWYQLASGIKDCRIIKNNWHIIQIHGILKPGVIYLFSIVIVGAVEHKMRERYGG